MANESFTSSSRGYGKWSLEIYTPSKCLGPIEGYLLITKEYHIIFSDALMKDTILNIPSQNVAYVQKYK